MYDQGSSQRSGQQEAKGVDPKWLGKWLKAMQEQQIEQTKYLRTISRAARVVELVVALGIILGAISVLGGF